MTASEFAARVRDGMLRADETYRDWTNGWGIAHGGIEGFITTWVAKHLVEEARRQQGPQSGYAALELRLDELLYDLSADDRTEHFSRLLDAARESDPRIAESLAQRARVDLVYYDRPWPRDADKLRPRGLVEVKRWFDANTYPKDMRRLANLLTAFGPRNGGSLLYGTFVFFKFERDGARESLQKVLDKIREERPKYQEYGCDCEVEFTLLPTSDGSVAKAASVSVTFEAPV